MTVHNGNDSGNSWGVSTEQENAIIELGQRLSQELGMPAVAAVVQQMPLNYMRELLGTDPKNQKEREYIHQKNQVFTDLMMEMETAIRQSQEIMSSREERNSTAGREARYYDQQGGM